MKKEVIFQGFGWGYLLDFLVDEELVDGCLFVLVGLYLLGCSEEVVVVCWCDCVQGLVVECLWVFLWDNVIVLWESGMDIGGDDLVGVRCFW